MVVAYLFPLGEDLGRWREFSEHILSGYVRRLGWLAPLVLTAGIAVLAAVGFSRLILCAIASMVLGFWQGLFWAQLGTLLGNYAVFVITRGRGKDWAQRLLSKRGRVQDFLQREGIAGVILARQLPVPGLLVNVACGLVSVRHRDFLMGTALGQLPEAIPFALIGAGVLKDSAKKSAGLIFLAVAIAALLWIGRRRFLARRRKAA